MGPNRIGANLEDAGAARGSHGSHVAADRTRLPPLSDTRPEALFTQDANVQTP